MRELKSSVVSSALFQEYLEGVSRAQEEEQNIRAQTLLMANAELQYRLYGGSRCTVCNASVRHVIPVTVERKDGHRDQYRCLCTRCFEGERAQSRKIILELGDAKWEQRPREVRKDAPAKHFNNLISLNGKAKAV